jgi:hypothetical protein
MKKIKIIHIVLCISFGVYVYFIYSNLTGNVLFNTNKEFEPNAYGNGHK